MRQVITFVTLAVVVLGCRAVSSAADWPGFRGSNADGFSPETNINRDWKNRPPKVLWRAPMHDDGFAGPAAADGKVFIIDHQGDEEVVRAIDINTGKDVWTVTYPDTAKANYGYSRSTPLIDNGKVYTTSRMGLVHCLDAGTGRKIWSKDLQGEFGGKLPGWLMAMSPVVDGDRLIVCPGGRDAGVAALDKETGKTIWAGGGSDKIGYTTPVVGTLNGKKQYIVFTAYHLMGVDPDDGKVLWQYPWKTRYDVNAAMPIILGKDTVFITSGYGHGCALLKVSGNGATVVWENKHITAHFSSPLLFMGYIYGNSDPGNLVCLDPRNGRALWKQGGFEKGGLIAVDGTLIAMNGRGGDAVMVELTNTGYKELGRIQPFERVARPVWTAPIVADKKLIVRDKRSLVCIDLK